MCLNGKPFFGISVNAMAIQALSTMPQNLLARPTGFVGIDTTIVPSRHVPSLCPRI